MKAAIIFDNFGPYHLARLQAAAQVCELLAVEIAGSSAEYAWEGRTQAKGQESGDGFKAVTLFPQGTSSNAQQQELAQRINRTLNDFAPQAVFIPGWSSRAALAALNWCAHRKVAAVMMSESTEWDEERSSWREVVKKRIVRLCSAALVGGQAHQDYMVKLGMPRARTFLGYDAVDNDYFFTKAPENKLQEETRRNLGLPQKYFLASARFIEKKNLSRLLEAYAEYRSRLEKVKGQEIGNRSVLRDPSQGMEIDAPWDLVLLGDGELRSSLLDLQASLGLDDYIHMPGFIQYPGLPAYYGLAGAFVHVSTTEQWGLVVNEAMASGLPVLVSNRCGCAPDLVQDGVNGFKFDPYNVEQLAQLMLKISAPDFPRSTFGEVSRKIISDWGPQRFANGFKSAVECAINSGCGSPGSFDRVMLAMLTRK